VSDKEKSSYRYWLDGGPLENALKEVKRLTEENKILKKENEQLIQILDAYKPSDKN
jgi:cell shape-determining protein MreC